MNHRTIVFDIDGVLADCKHRLHHILTPPKDWETFDSLTHLDTPIYNCIRLLWAISTNPFIDIILLTGRSERVREATEKWLSCQDIPLCKLEMRADGDHRPAAVIKTERLQRLPHCSPSEVVTIFEDHPGTIVALREAGYHVCDVGGWEEGYTEILHTGGRDDETVTSNDGGDVLPTKHT